MGTVGGNITTLVVFIFYFAQFVPQVKVWSNMRKTWKILTRATQLEPQFFWEKSFLGPQDVV